MSAHPARRIPGVALALACTVAAVWQAAQHPLAPGLAVALWAACAMAAMRWPDAWLVGVPAALPLLSLAPWTGWVARDEFDLLLLAALAAGHLQSAFSPTARPPGPAASAAPARTGAVDWFIAALWAWLLLGVLLGWLDAQRATSSLPEAYAAFGNTLRVAKSQAFALLAVPLLRAALRRSADRAQRRLCTGMVIGLVGVSAAVLWERAAFPGLLDFVTDYRTTALFWEMHVGGAAIDAYLALAMPFAAWALVSARRPAAWIAAAVLAQVLAYVCLTTFARGVYGAVLGGLVVQAWLVRRQCAVQDHATPQWRTRANAALRVALVLEVAAMAAASTFLAHRISDADNDFGSRWSHWQRGLGIAQTPADWLLGAGLGRLPARFAALGPAEEFPGAATVMSTPEAPPQHFLRLHGPGSRQQLAGRYALTQQVEAVPGTRYRVAFDVRSAQDLRLSLRVCERHLLYEADCQTRTVVRRGQAEPAWEHVEVPLSGPSFRGGTAGAPRLVALGIAVASPGAAADIDNVRLSAAGRPVALANGGFEAGLARWYPAVKAYFLPWHIDNLYLEALIERGAVGLLLLAGLMAWALWNVSFGPARSLPAAPYVAASLASVCALGLVSSILDMPRVAFMCILLTLWAAHLRPVSPESGRSAGPAAL